MMLTHTFFDKPDSVIMDNLTAVYKMWHLVYSTYLITNYDDTIDA